MLNARNRQRIRPINYNYNQSAKPKRKVFKWFSLLVALVIVVSVGFELNKHYSDKPATVLSSATQNSTTTQTVTKTATTTVNPCASNTLDKLVLVSISQRQLWACSNTTVAYNSPVITGMDFLAADLTPTGTYHIYAKETDITLSGSDSTGSWNDFVYYWMPFLDNQYGAYGFHDATWRSPNAFGNVSPSSNIASHGCVECPLATAKWLYGWTEVGTTVTIEA